MKKKIIILPLVCLFILMSFAITHAQVIIGGDSIGIEGKYDGVYVSGTYHFNINEEVIKPEKTIKNKDIIIEVNSNKISDIQSFISAVSFYQEQRNVIPITVIRDNQKINTTLLSTYKPEGSQFGLYIKDRILGIGTLTFYDPDTMVYGALGHSISEEDNTYLQTGSIYDASISNIKKAEKNQPGEKNGSIQFEEKIGNIEENTDIGIYGDLYQNKDKQALDVATLDEIQLGKATFYTTISNSDKKAFAIEIIDIQKNAKQQKAITFKVVDETILDKCGGIIHGMSGSPIIQNNKIIGAITHVKVEDPTIGYGIFINDMVNEAQN